MIKLENVSKTYISKAKREVKALKNVNFELDRGMVFILGKSGSGKSTLLNLLGGLDAPTEGVITVDGVDMSNFKQADYDAYRNGYVGFVFQDFNLLPDFNVKDNVAFALQLSRGDNIDGKVKDALLQVELGEEYLTRRVGELSGGERQRIAIARSIVKDSKLILADEPTGNLDSKTGESVWNILKNISQTKLVVVVSHDRDSAEKYADRIIEIADGEIISDRGATASDVTTEPFVAQRKRLSFATCVKMGANSIRRHVVRTVSVILLSILTMLALLITQMGLSFSVERTYAQLIRDIGVPYFSVMQGYEQDGEVVTSSGNYLNYDSIQYLNDNADFIADSVVKNKQQLLDFGFTFIGDALELTSNSFYIVDSAILEYYVSSSIVIGNGYYINDNGEKVSFQNSKPYMGDLVGKQVFFDNMGFAVTDTTPTLAGILSLDGFDLFVSAPNIFYRKDFENKRSDDTLILNSVNSDYQLRFSNKYFNGLFALLPEKSSIWQFSSGKIITRDNQLQDLDFAKSLANDEVIITFELYSQLFSAEPLGYYVSPDMQTVLNPIPEIGQSFELKIHNNSNNALIIDLGTYKLAGVAYGSGNLGEYSGVLMSDSAIDVVCKNLELYKNVLVRSDSVKDLTNFMFGLRDNALYVREICGMRVYAEYEVQITDITFLVKNFQGLIESITPIIEIICGIFASILLLMLINLISLSITKRKKEIGILSALGTSNRDITKIFIVEVMVIAVISFVVTLALAFVSASVLNIYFCKLFEYTLPLLNVTGYTVLTLVAACAVLILVAYLPIRQIAKLKPIDAIRNI